MSYEVNLREYRRGNNNWTIQRNSQHRKQQDEERQIQNTTRYVLDTTIRKQTQITQARHTSSYK
jgi:hypothetical protein